MFEIIQNDLKNLEDLENLKNLDNWVLRAFWDLTCRFRSILSSDLGLNFFWVTRIDMIASFCAIWVFKNLDLAWFRFWVFKECKELREFWKWSFWTFSVLGATYERSWTQFFESCFPSNKQLQKENSGFVKTSDEYIHSQQYFSTVFHWYWIQQS